MEHKFCDGNTFVFDQQFLVYSNVVFNEANKLLWKQIP